MVESLGSAGSPGVGTPLNETLVCFTKVHEHGNKSLRNKTLTRETQGLPELVE
jgi:hypothetical protein